jgi:serine/threonine protein phosphatase PrpC
MFRRGAATLKLSPFRTLLIKADADVNASAMRQKTAGSRRSRRTMTNVLGGLVSSGGPGSNSSSSAASSLALFVAVGCFVNLFAVAMASDGSTAGSGGGSSNQQQQDSSSAADSSSSTAANGHTPYAALQSSHKTYEGVYSATPPIAGIECPTYGCPVLPRDIAFDAHAKEALESIRALYTASSSSSSSSDADADSTEGASSVDTAASEQALATLGSAGGDDHATLTLIGYKGGRMDDQVNQDRAFLVAPYMGKTSRRIVGVFDGHGRGGEYVSDFTVTHLPDHLAAKLGGDGDKSAEEVKKVLFDAFVEMDRSARATPEHVTGGCTATVVLQLDDKAYIANAGDSRSFIATYSKSTKETKVVYVTREDKPHLPEERQRVESMGGRVRLPPQAGGTSRVMYRDAITGGEYGLAMSRSIGDWAAGEVGVIPDPLVDAVDLNELINGGGNSNDDGSGGQQTCTVSEDGEQECLATPAEVVEGDIQVFAVSATDGLLDYVAIDDIAKHVALGLYDDEEGPHLLSACEALISAAAGGWHRHRQGRYRDDIAISVSKLTW